MFPPSGLCVLILIDNVLIILVRGVLVADISAMYKSLSSSSDEVGTCAMSWHASYTH